MLRFYIPKTGFASYDCNTGMCLATSPGEVYVLEGLFITSLDFLSGMRLSKNEEFTHIFNNGLQFSWCIDPIDVESFTSHCGSVTNQNMHMLIQ